jgi:murein L,D-transpeptidase YcbB/YkuD
MIRLDGIAALLSEDTLNQLDAAPLTENESSPDDFLSGLEAQFSEIEQSTNEQEQVGEIDPFAPTNLLDQEVAARRAQLSTPSFNQEAANGEEQLPTTFNQEPASNSARVPRKNTGRGTLERALQKVADIEGGLNTRKDETGGGSNHGVTLATLRSLRPGATMKDLKALTEPEAIDIFRTEFVNKPGIDRLPNVVQAEMVALSVNAGPRAAIKALQRGIGVTANGVIGPSTVAAAGKLTNAQIKSIVDNFYRDLVARIPAKKVHLKGWLNRSAIVNSID